MASPLKQGRPCARLSTSGVGKSRRCGPTITQPQRTGKPPFMPASASARPPPPARDANPGSSTNTSGRSHQLPRGGRPLPRQSARALRGPHWHRTIRAARRTVMIPGSTTTSAGSPSLSPTAPRTGESLDRPDRQACRTRTRLVHLPLHSSWLNQDRDLLLDHPTKVPHGPTLPPGRTTSRPPHTSNADSRATTRAPGSTATSCPRRRRNT